MACDGVIENHGDVQKRAGWRGDTLTMSQGLYVRVRGWGYQEIWVNLQVNEDGGVYGLYYSSGPSVVCTIVNSPSQLPAAVVYLNSGNGDFEKLLAATMDVPARLVGDKTMMPLRFLSEELGYTVEWDEETRMATIRTEDRWEQSLQVSSHQTSTLR